MIISIDGNIGSGKSSALAAIADAHATFAEPVAEWSLLESFYGDRDAFALPFQLEVLESYAGVPGTCPPGGLLVTERSPLTCRDVFGKLLVNDGALTPAQWDVYNRWYDRLGWTPDGIVFIDTPPATCLERIAERGRPSEVTGVDLEYLERLDRAHKVLAAHAGVRVEIVDGTRPCADVEAAVRRAVASLAAAVTSTAS